MLRMHSICACALCPYSFFRHLHALLISGSTCFRLCYANADISKRSVEILMLEFTQLTSHFLHTFQSVFSCTNRKVQTQCGAMELYCSVTVLQRYGRVPRNAAWREEVSPRRKNLKRAAQLHQYPVDPISCPYLYPEGHPEGHIIAKIPLPS